MLLYILSRNLYLFTSQSQALPTKLASTHSTEGHQGANFSVTTNYPTGCFAEANIVTAPHLTVTDDNTNTWHRVCAPLVNLYITWCGLFMLRKLLFPAQTACYFHILNITQMCKERTRRKWPTFRRGRYHVYNDRHSPRLYGGRYSATPARLSVVYQTVIPWPC